MSAEQKHVARQSADKTRITPPKASNRRKRSEEENHEQNEEQERHGEESEQDLVGAAESE